MNVSTVRVCPHCDSLVDVTDGGAQPTCPECGRAWTLLGAPNTPPRPAAAASRPEDVRRGRAMLAETWDQELERRRTGSIGVGVGGFAVALRVAPRRAFGLIWLLAGVLFASHPWNATGGVLTVFPPVVASALALAVCVAIARHEVRAAVALALARRGYAASQAKIAAGRPLVTGDWGHDAGQPTPPVASPRRIGLWLAIYAAAGLLSAGIVLGNADQYPNDRDLHQAVIDLPFVGTRPWVVDPGRLQTVAEVWTWAGAAATAVLVAAAMRVPREE